MGVGEEDEEVERGRARPKRQAVPLYLPMFLSIRVRLGNEYSQT